MPRRSGRPRGSRDIVGQPLERHAPVLDHLERASGFRETARAGARQAAHGPQRVEARPVDRRWRRARAGAQATHGVADHASGRRLRLTLELDQQEPSSPRASRGRAASRTKSSSVRSKVRLPKGSGPRGMGPPPRAAVDPEPEGSAGHVRRDRLEAPLDCRDEGERPLRPDQRSISSPDSA